MDARAKDVAPPPDVARLLGDVAALLPAMQMRAAQHDEDGSFPETDLEELRAMGALAAPLPPSLGGLGLIGDAAGLCVLLRVIGRGSLVLGRVFEGHVNALQLIVRYGTPAQIRTAADEAWAGELFGVWNTQAHDAPLHLHGEALRGAKVLCSGAGFVTRALVTADLPNGCRQMVVAHLSPGERADLSGWTAQGMRGSATGRVHFDGLDAPAATRIGKPDDYVGQPELSGGAWRVLAVFAGGLDGLAEAVSANLVARGRDGDPHQRARAGRLFALQQTARLWALRAGEIAGGGGEAEQITAFVDLARGAVEEACTEALTLAGRSLGLAGFMRPEPAERIARDLATYLRQPAPDAALTNAAGYFLRNDLP